MKRLFLTLKGITVLAFMVGFMRTGWAISLPLNANETQLLNAAVEGDGERVAFALKAGANINAQCVIGISWEGPGPRTTALMLASIRGHERIVKALIEAGADVNVVNRFGLTALLGASYCGHTEIVKALIEADADIDAMDLNKQTVLMYACLGLELYHKVVLHEDLDPNIDRICAIDFNIRPLLVSGSMRDHAETVEALIAANHNIDARDGRGETALMKIAQRNPNNLALGVYLRCAQALVNAGADITIKTKFFHKTALDLAKEVYNQEMVHFLERYPHAQDIHNFVAEEWYNCPFDVLDYEVMPFLATTTQPE